MNVYRQHSKSSARGGIALGLLVALAAAIGASEARADDVTAYASSLANQLAAEKAALDGAMRQAAAKANRSLDQDTKAALERKVKPVELARAPTLPRGQG